MLAIIDTHFLPDMDVRMAIATAKRCRPIIDPIGQLPEFLHRLRRAYEAEHPLYGQRESVASGSTMAADIAPKKRAGGAK